MDTYSDIDAENGEEAIEEFELLEHASPSQPEITVENLDEKWMVKDLSDGKTVECVDKQEVIDTLYRPIVEKLCSPESFEVAHNGKTFKPFLIIDLEPKQR